MATCYVGFYIPKNGGSIDPGIVDLRIAATVKHHGVDVNQPIYSYRKGNRIDVFESAYIAQKRRLNAGAMRGKPTFISVARRQYGQKA